MPLPVNHHIPAKFVLNSNFTKVPELLLDNLPAPFISAELKDIFTYQKDGPGEYDSLYCYLNYRAVIFIPRNEDTPSPDYVNVMYWHVPETDNFVVLIKYNYDPPIPAPASPTFFEVRYIEFQIEGLEDVPYLNDGSKSFKITTYLNDIDPGTSRGTETTVQPATPQANS
jgi:hypothetical protein